MSLDEFLQHLTADDDAPGSRERAARDFGDACRRADADPRERQRARDIADLADAEDALYEEAVAAAARGDRARAVPLLLRAARAGIGEAAWLLAGLLEEDDGRAAEAISWYQRAACDGDSRAGARLAELYARRSRPRIVSARRPQPGDDARRLPAKPRDPSRDDLEALHAASAPPKGSLRVPARVPAMSGTGHLAGVLGRYLAAAGQPGGESIRGAAGMVLSSLSFGAVLPHIAAGPTPAEVHARLRTWLARTGRHEGVPAEASEFLAAVIFLERSSLGGAASRSLRGRAATTGAAAAPERWQQEDSRLSALAAPVVVHWAAHARPDDAGRAQEAEAPEDMQALGTGPASASTAEAGRPAPASRDTGETPAADVYALALQACRDFGDEAGAARALLELSIVNGRSGRHEAALRHAEDAAALFRAAADQRGRGDALDHAGVLHRNSGRFREALARHRTAAGLYRDTGDKGGEAGALSHAGIALYHLGRYPDAMEQLRRALGIYRMTDDRRNVARTLSNLAKMLLHHGGYRDALQHYQEALRIFTATGGEQNQAIVYHNIGCIHRSLEDYDQALAAYRQAIAVYRRIGDQPGVLSVLNDTGITYQALGNFSRALADHRRANELAEQADDSYERVIALRGIADALRGQGQHDEAVCCYESAIRLARETGERYQEGKALEGLADAIEQTQGAAAARIFQRQAVDALEPLGVPDTEAIRFRLGFAGQFAVM